MSFLLPCAFVAISVEIEPGPDHLEACRPPHLLLINRVNRLVVNDFPASQTNEIPMMGGIAVIAILHLIELENPDHILLLKLVEQIVDSCEADS